METAKKLVRNFEYTDSHGNVGHRRAMFYKLPEENLHALDLTELTVEEIETVLSAYDKYLEFLKTIPIISFSDWLNENKLIDAEKSIKHRKFNINRIKLTNG